MAAPELHRHADSDLQPHISLQSCAICRYGPFSYRNAPVAPNLELPMRKILLAAVAMTSLFTLTTLTAFAALSNGSVGVHARQADNLTTNVDYGWHHRHWHHRRWHHGHWNYWN